MCNLYSQIAGPDEIRQAVEDVDVIERTGNLAPQRGIYPDYAAPVLRHGEGGMELSMARWGMPTPPRYLTGKRTDPGVTNVRRVDSPHWRRWLGVEHRCLVPFTSFSEMDSRPGAPRNHPVWFALDERRPLAFFAGIRTHWTSVRKLKEGETTDELFAFLTSDPNREVGEVHPKAMPVILTEPEEWKIWMTAPVLEALCLQRPLPDGRLHIVAEGVREDARAWMGASIS
ncbi:SOS response-associated peptidase [Falsirhodobacter sp. 20TX0035]|uniref:SOS response-associated peptidase n=1 Tax=Falsirhodobacter sp. 20TX0035 TaxID=3022019 RepID=UPI0023301032|nr:SOS response-associated peptidase family protein [Falsirhodobacter sp. 20TX0035]MDB6454292.1 SOS response-associated peptidase family protein [Falsirhodobacter sp. 20TX0035]